MADPAGLDVLGLGVWSDRFADLNDLMTGLRTGTWKEAAELRPELIAPRERRRAPKPVRMAVEVMRQACDMAAMAPAAVSTVFASAMGDMQITDNLCSCLAADPRTVSPTRFHNSVHNAPVGYWSIATRSDRPASAVSAYEYTAPAAFLEAAIQAVEEAVPVLVVVQEVEAPHALRSACPTDVSFSGALLLSPSVPGAARLARLTFGVRRGRVGWPPLPAGIPEAFSSNFGARLLPLLTAIAGASAAGESAEVRFPVSGHSELVVGLTDRRSRTS